MLLWNQSSLELLPSLLLDLRVSTTASQGTPATFPYILRYLPLGHAQSARFLPWVIIVSLQVLHKRDKQPAH